MGRRSTLVAFAAIAAMLVPVSAYAATAPSGFTVTATGGNTTPVVLGWTTTVDDVAQQAFRVAGACPATIPDPGAIQITTPGAPLGGGVSAATDTPPDGTWCYYVRADDALLASAYTGGLQVTVDRPSTGTVGVTPVQLGGGYHGTVNVAGTSADAGSGVASSVLHASTGDCPSGAVVGAGWDTVTVADAVYNVCNVVTDGVGNVTVVQTIQVLVDNTAPLGAIATPAAGAFVAGNAQDPVPLTLTGAADATAGIRNVQWQRSGNGTTGWANIGPAIASPADGYLRNWNPAAAGVGDGPDYLRAIVTDNAGNALITPTTPVTVDNTPPDDPAVVTAPPVVAGSPTMSWTPAHDAIGIARYDVLRGASVIGTVASIAGAQTYSFNDQYAPDQVTSNYVVRAYDNTNHFINSATVSVLVDSKAESAPHNLAAVTPTSGPPVLTWQAPVSFNVDHYDVWRDGLLLASTTGPALTYTDTSADEGVHDYAVLARSPNSQPGVLSSSFKVLLDLTPPTSGGAPTAQVLPAGAVQLAWPAADDALSGVAGYIVRRAAGGIPPATADGGIAVCAPTATDCADAATASGTWSYGVFARDVAGNVALIGTVAGVVINDKTAPLAPTKLKLSLVRTKSKKPSTNLTYTLRWVMPTAPDLDRVVVVLSLKRPPTLPGDGKAIYKGLGTSTKVKVRAGQTAYLALFAYDHSGNFSPKPARKAIRLASLIPLRPLSGSVVRSSSPLLSWKATKGTLYYNLQVFVNGKRVLVGWPSQAAYRIPAGKLSPGTYVWYVWPAIKHKGSAPTFGKLIGRATFTYKK